MARLEIRRDAAGVPFVKGRTPEDMFHGMGMAHAQDRLLQMTTLLLLGEGRASEHLADIPLLFDYDVKLRSLALVADAREQMSMLPGDLAALLGAYADGVNAVAFAGGRPRPTLEMRLVKLAPRRWEPWCSLLILKVMAFVGLAEIQEDAERFVIEAVREGVDPAKLKELFHPYLEELDADLLRSLVTARGMSQRPAVVQGLAAAGSNAFAVAGARTVSGHAMLANDPHLQVNRLPSVWAEIMTECQGRQVIGSSIPGGPGLVSARSPDLAWGVTYSMGDVIDFYVEDVKDGKVRREDGWETLSIRQESIGRRGKEPAAVEVRESSLGILEGAGDGPQLCMAWAGHRATGAATFRAMHQLTFARSVAEAREIVAATDIPPLNWILADRKGNVAWQLGGRYPVRRPGWSGLHPVPGWEARNRWQGFRDAASLPHVENPPSGVVVTANHNRNDAGQPPYISVPHPDCRAKRIEKILDPPGKVHLDILRTAQLDTKSLQAERLLPRLLPSIPDGPQKEALSRWDCRYVPESPEATLFENLWREVVLTVFGDGGLGRPWLADLLATTSLDVFLFGHFDDVLMRADSLWLPRDRREATLRGAALRAFARPWPPWGEHATFTFAHLILGGQLPAILGYDRGPFPVRGSRATPAQGSLFQRNGRPILIAPSYRVLMEIGDEMALETCVPGGSSEKRMSGRYASEIKAWLEGRYKRLAPDAARRVDVAKE